MANLISRPHENLSSSAENLAKELSMLTIVDFELILRRREHCIRKSGGLQQIFGIDIKTHVEGTSLVNPTTLRSEV